MARFHCAVAAGALALCLIGCGESEPSPADFHDAQIVDSWIPGRPTQDAIEFLEGGGVYGSLNTATDIDRKYLLPLLRRLRDEFDLESTVLLDDPQIAFAVVIDVSTVPKDRSGIVDAFEEADEAFPGLVLEKWGNNWLSIDLLDAEDAESLVGGQQLSELKRNLAAERELIRTGF